MHKIFYLAIFLNGNFPHWQFSSLAVLQLAVFCLAIFRRAIFRSRNSTYGLRWPRVPHPLWDFALLPISLPTIVALFVSSFTFLYFLFLLHFLQFPALFILIHTFPSKRLWLISRDKKDFYLHYNHFPQFLF